MSKVLVFGSINIDQVFKVPSIVRPGETLSSLSQELFAGGKGANQSVAIAKAGGKVFHIGKVGTDGQFIIDQMKDSGVNTDLVQVSNKEFSGRATIQVCEKSSENAIILSPNSNFTIDIKVVEDQINNTFNSGDWLVLQNEVLGNEKVIEISKAKGMKIVFNPAPMTDEIVKNFPFNKVDIIIVNQIEFEALVQGCKIENNSNNIEETAKLLLNHDKFSNCDLLVITLGASGVCHLLKQPNNITEFNALPVVPPPSPIQDTTGAGDTFIGHFIATLVKLANNKDISKISPNYIDTSCKFGMAAASIGITKPGAMNSIPSFENVKDLLGINL